MGVTNCLWKLYGYLSDIHVPEDYEILFCFNFNGSLGRTGHITITVREKESGYKMSWAVSPTEIENRGMDFVKDNIEAMIERMWEDE